MVVKFEGRDIADYKIETGLVDSKDFHRAIFEEGRIKKLIFRNCDLRNAEFLNITFENVIFDNCLLVSSIFNRCNFNDLVFVINSKLHYSFFESNIGVLEVDFNSIVEGVILNETNLIRNNNMPLWVCSQLRSSD